MGTVIVVVFVVFATMLASPDGQVDPVGDDVADMELGRKTRKITRVTVIMN